MLKVVLPATEVELLIWSSGPLAVLTEVVKVSQTYVEDCEVCCHPIELRYAIEDGAVVEFEARALE